VLYALEPSLWANVVAIPAPCCHCVAWLLLPHSPRPESVHLQVQPPASAGNLIPARVDGEHPADSGSRLSWELGSWPQACGSSCHGPRRLRDPILLASPCSFLRWYVDHHLSPDAMRCLPGAAMYADITSAVGIGRERSLATHCHSPTPLGVCRRRSLVSAMLAATESGQ
jgi:hypothetical protein